ncbi:LytTR family transcriptional regulator DNA-binding domain-containing protein [Metaclostridioides mangenotii]|uniref:LytTR family transcriptional regulator DNA-binding domain-containing protein n=1 Tax=Metaclostridioides mangenotii TaxID=1540 RepID=UPI0026F00203|nr:LytTR family transcriptional regulator DNA-binding domain-containing protein [Clostridioides mangenotii]
MKTLIIDDEPLARNELRYLLEQCEEITDIKEAETIEEAFAEMLNNKPDLLFLDIHLSDESGLSLAERLLSIEEPPMIIFATAYDEHAVRAFELNATDYILKPFDLDRIKKAVKKANKKYEIKSNYSLDSLSTDVTTLPIQVDESIFVLKIEDILAVVVEEGKTSVYTNQEIYHTATALSTYEKKLPSAQFLRVHRSYIINKNYIKEIQPWFNHTYQVTLENKLKVPVSRSYIKEFKSELGI